MRFQRVMALALMIGAGLLSAAGAAEAPIRTLILSGDNNHDWKTTTPYLEKILEESGRFTCDVHDMTAEPQKLTPEMLAGYDLVLSNWTNYQDRTRTWGEPAERALFNFVKEQGKGFALFHAAAATFPEWPEFAKFAGAGWVPRTGEPGQGSGHGDRHTYKIEITDKMHPITQGLEDFYHNDELWHRLADVPGVTKLARAFSDPKVRGSSGNYEPMAIVQPYGKGRTYFLVPGHDVLAMSNPAWRTLMLRGAEWAATGKVTIGKQGPWPLKPEDAPAPPPKEEKAAKTGKAKKAAKK